jgi:hypothetical protein
MSGNSFALGVARPEPCEGSGRAGTSFTTPFQGVPPGIPGRPHLTQSEFESTKRDAWSTESRTPAQRIETFIDLLDAVETIRSGLSIEERIWRKQIADKLQPLPKPGWRNFRQEALEEFRCRISSN